MPKSNAVWGIDIGNAALKALRVRSGDAPDEIIADAFDFIEYPKILSEPGAEPPELVSDAIKQFLKRNTLKGDRVVMSVPGQTGLARFIKLPPVETKKIPDIVAFEARQQIPFALEDVVWDYQQMPGGMVEEGFALEAEVGLFAMKREQVYRALEPLTSVGVDVQMVQLAPLALYSFLVFDQMVDLPPPEEFIPDAPPPSVVIVSMGTDATDLVITNGYRVWQRSIPIGGNHFTRALTKDLKLTFAKAEHLKRNATAAEDPKAVFQAMRPVFSDLLTEIQRSIGYFTTIDRAASIDHLVGLGNAMKLPGLRKYLAQSLGHEVKQIQAFRGLKGDEVVETPAFKENRLSFGVAYGLALQGLDKAPLKTNLLPSEILRERLIQSKKPWAVAAVALLLLGLTVSFVSYARALETVDNEGFSTGESRIDQVAQKAEKLEKEAAAAAAELASIKQIGQNLTSNVEGRIRWLELLRALNSCLPSDPEGERPEDISQRNEIYLNSIEFQWVPDLRAWFSAVKKPGWYLPPGAESATDSAAVGVEGPSGPGYVVQVGGYHFHNWDAPDKGTWGAQYLRDTFMAALHDNQVFLPRGEVAEGEEPMELVSLKDLGIGFPALIDPPRPVVMELKNPNLEGGGRSAARTFDDGGGVDEGSDMDMEEPGGGGAGDGGAGVARGAPRRVVAERNQEANPVVRLGRFDFVVQFAWKPTPRSVRQAKKAAEEAAQAAAAGEAAGNEETADGGQ